MRTRSWLTGAGLVIVVIVGAIVYGHVSGAPPGEGRITGNYRAYDDTGLPSRTIGTGTFLVIPGTSAHDVWPELESGLHQYPDFSPATLDLPGLEDTYGASLVKVQPNGRFRIAAEEGPAVVCLIGIRTLNGCVDVELASSESVEARFGEGGFHIE